MVLTKKPKAGEVLAYPSGHLAVTLVSRRGVAHVHTNALPLGVDVDGGICGVLESLKRFVQLVEQAAEDLRGK